MCGLATKKYSSSYRFISDDLKWALQVLSHACTDTPHNLHLDIRLHVTRAEGLVSPLIDVTDKRPQTSHIDNLSPLSPADKHEPLEASLKGSQDEMTTSIEVSTMEGHSISRRKDYLKIHLGRPNIPTIVQEEIETSSGPVSVNGTLVNPFIHKHLLICFSFSMRPCSSYKGGSLLVAVWCC